jgi:C4-dicarboxylate-specific signal transduction histidine kinase
MAGRFAFVALARLIYVAKGKGVLFFFSDSGACIPENLLPSIFNAFFTTKKVRGEGSG